MPRMNLPHLRLLAALACLGLASPFTVTARAAEAAELPKFRSVLIDGQAPLFSLSDATGTGRWLKTGESFEGWKVESFDLAKQILTVSRDGTKKELGLESGVIDEGEATATVAEADALLLKMRFEEMIEKSIEAQQSAMAKSMGGMFGKDMPEDQRARMTEFQGKIMSVMLAEMDLPGMRKDLAAVYAETFSSAELKAQSDFYSTPAGAAMIDKQPLIQERMTAIMMPRMMKAMPKIQAMGEEFAKEEKSSVPAKKPASPSTAKPATSKPPRPIAP